MNSRIQNRLIGLIAIVLIIIIFFPSYRESKSFDIANNTLRSTTTTTELPAEDSTQVSHSNPISLKREERMVPVRNKQQRKGAEVQYTHRTKIMTNENSKKYYTVQLVALKNKQKIEELLTLLKLHNYQAYVNEQRPAVGQVIRLYVGSYSSKEQAESAIIELSNLTKLKGIVVNK